MLNRDWSVLRRPLRVVLPQCANLKCAARERHLPANLGLSVDRRTGSRGQVSQRPNLKGPGDLGLRGSCHAGQGSSESDVDPCPGDQGRVGSGPGLSSQSSTSPRPARRRTSPVALIVDRSGRRGRLIPCSGLIEPLINRVAAMADAEATTTDSEATTVTNAARRRRQGPTGPETDATTTAARTDTEARREGTGRYMPGQPQG